MLKVVKSRPKLSLLTAACIALVVGLMHYFHWDDRLLFLWQEHQTSTQQQADSIWLPGYRAVIEAKPLAE